MGRLGKLPPYLFSAIDAAKAQALAAGRDVVDLGIGDPDRPTPPVLQEAMVEAVRRPSHHRYPNGRGSAELRRTIAGWLARRHGVTVDPETQVLVLIGSKEGLGHLPLSLLDEGDEVLVPDPGYPVYAESTLLAGGRPVPFRLRAELGFEPDLDELAGSITSRTRLLLLNYPNNPTGASGSRDLLRRAADLGRERDLAVVNDAAYLEVVPGGGRAVSLLECCDPATDRVLELHSLSKMFNMTGWRVGFAAGQPELVANLARVKESMDSGVFSAVQEVARRALRPEGDELLAGVMSVYAPRRARILAALAEAGIEVFGSLATFYVWCRVPGAEDSASFCARLLAEHDLVVTPGTGFGPGGEGWFRISLTAPDERIDEAAARLRRLGRKGTQ